MWGALLGVVLGHAVVESASVVRRVDVSGGIDDDAPFPLTFDEADRGEEEAVDEMTEPTREDKEKVIIAPIDDLFKNGCGRLVDTGMVIVQVAKKDVSPFAGVGGRQRGAVAENVERSIVVDNGEARGADMPADGSNRSLNRGHVDVVVGVVTP